MTFQYLYDTCGKILQGLQKFATLALDWFTTDLTFGNIINVTPIEILSTFFFTFLVARIVLNMVTG